mmetsp:Transcript_17184/g.47582  ORF Transcript_17184/g.47582 Transcript_17184/m.47582 type:complete len:464 (-) Transcript_17184:122-1513(-)
MRRGRSSIFIIHRLHSILLAGADHDLALLVDGIDEDLHQRRALLATKTFPEIGNQFLRSQNLEHLLRGLSHGLRRLAAIVDHLAWIVVALQRHIVTNNGACRGAIDLTVDGDDIESALGQLGVGKAGAAAEHHQRHVGEAHLQLRLDLLEARHGELVEILLVDHHAHGLEDLQHVRALLDLRRHVLDDDLGQRLQQRRGFLGVLLQPLHAELRVLLGRSADHVKQEGPRRGRESDERDGLILGLHLGADLTHGLEDVSQLVLNEGWRDVVEGWDAGRHVLRCLQWVRYEDADAARHGHLDAQGFGDDEDVGKQDGGVHVVSSQRLHGAFRHAIRIRQQIQKVAPRLLLVRLVLRQMAPGLSEQPQRRLLHRLSQSRADHEIVGGTWVGLVFRLAVLVEVDFEELVATFTGCCDGIARHALQNDLARQFQILCGGGGARQMTAALCECRRRLRGNEGVCSAWQQ